jgi:Tfp pilus assembly protein PilF
MKIHVTYILLGGLILLFITSCTKKLVPSTLNLESGKSNKLAAFNYVYVEAIKQKLQGNSGDALEYFEQCLNINPQSDAVYYQMAQIVISGGDIANGKRFLLNAEKLNPKNFWYLMSLADIYYKEKNIDSSIVFYEKAVEYFPDKEELQLTLGNLYAENKNYSKAKSVFDSFDKKYGVNETSTLSAVKSLMAAGDFEEALVKINLLIKEYPEEVFYKGLLAEIYRGKGDNEKALEVYTQLLEKEPDNPNTLLAFSDFLIKEKSYNELLLLLNTIATNSRVQKQDKISLVAQLIDEPELITDKGDSLIEILKILENSYKDDDIVVLLRPEVLIRKNDFYNAAKRLNEIIEARPDNYYAWEKLLFIYLQEKDYDNLFLKGEECATRFNRSFVAKVLFANGALEKGKYDIALEEIRKAEILAGDNIENKMQVLTMRADIYYRNKNFPKAFDTFEEAKNLRDSDLTVLNNYAYYLAEQNTKLNEAEEMAKKVIKKEGKNTTYLDTYAWVLFKRSKLTEAAKVMETIINSGDKPDPVWYEHYGYILKKQNKCTDAVENWKISLKLDSTKTELLKEIENCKK